MRPTDTTQTRRNVLLGSASIGALALAGCLGGDDEGDGDDHDDVEGNGDDHDDDDHEDDHSESEVAEAEFDYIGIEEFSLHDEHGDRIAWVHGDHWDGRLPQIPVDGSVSLEAHVETETGEELTFEDEYELRVAYAHDAPEGALSFDTHGKDVSLAGEEIGVTDIVFLIWHDDHADYQTPGLTAQVVDEVDDDYDDDHDDHDHDDHHDDDHHDDDHH